MMKVTAKHLNQVTTTIWLSLLLIHTTSNTAEAIIKELSTNEEPTFRDPIVWDLRSLYKSTSKLDDQSVLRFKRSTTGSTTVKQTNQQLVDACQSKMEILTPYYATNSKGKIRIVVNSELMQQAIQVETCTRLPTSEAKCNSQADCGCEQKYKWHRLLVSDPSESGRAKGLFMDWFLFPSSCNCRCKDSISSSKQFLRTTMRRTSG